MMNLPVGSKTGCPGLSLPPGLACVPGIGCLGCCYANQVDRTRPNVVKSRRENFLAILEHPIQAAEESARVFNRSKAGRYRLAVAGDMGPATWEYLDHLLTLVQVPGLLFTKFHSTWSRYWDNQAGLQVIMSQWPGEPWQGAHRIAAVIPSQGQALDNWFLCPGDCSSCLACWDPQGPVRIAFQAHGPRARQVDQAIYQDADYARRVTA